MGRIVLFCHRKWRSSPGQLGGVGVGPNLQFFDIHRAYRTERISSGGSLARIGLRGCIQRGTFHVCGDIMQRGPKQRSETGPISREALTESLVRGLFSCSVAPFRCRTFPQNIISWNLPRILAEDIHSLWILSQWDIFCPTVALKVRDPSVDARPKWYIIGHEGKFRCVDVK